MKEFDTMEKEIELEMSNFDHTIDNGLAELLKENEGKVYAQYAGWNFCGYVWFENDKFVCQVWCYKSPQEEIIADTLEEIMDMVSEKWGYN